MERHVFLSTCFSELTPKKNQTRNVSLGEADIIIISLKCSLSLPFIAEKFLNGVKQQSLTRIYSLFEKCDQWCWFKPDFGLVLHFYPHTFNTCDMGNLYHMISCIIFVSKIQNKNFFLDAFDNGTVVTCNKLVYR